MTQRLSRNLYLNVVLTAIAILLGVLAVRPAIDTPPVVHAQADRSYLYVEPGTTAIRPTDGFGMMQGKVMIDMRTGDVWGFPTDSGAPYPVSTTSSAPPVSKPVYLGRFDLSAMVRPKSGG